MSRWLEIVSDEAVEKVHGNANFGSMSKRRVVDLGVLSYAFGFSTGHTMMTILIEHRLIKTPRPGSYQSALTKKGSSYLRTLAAETPLEDILNLMESNRERI